MSTNTNFFTADFLKKTVPFFDEIEKTAKKTESCPYIVGGSVRDMIMGRQLNDVDIVVFGCDYENFATILAKTIRAAPIPFKDNFRIMKNGVVIDVSKPRGGDIHEDLGLRDFTINNLAANLEGKILGDMADIDNKIIRCVYDTSFDDDPLRLLRAFRFRSTLGFSITEDTVKLIYEKKHLAPIPAKERVLEELKKTFDGFYFKEILNCPPFLELMGTLAPNCLLNAENALRVKDLEKETEDIFPIFLALFFQGEGAEKFFKNLKLSVRELKIIASLIKTEKQINFIKLDDGLERQKTAWRFYSQLQNIIVFLKCKYPQHNRILWELAKSAETVHVDAAGGINGEDLKALGIAPSPLFSQILDDAKEKLALCLVDPKDIKDYIKKKYNIQDLA